MTGARAALASLAALLAHGLVAGALPDPLSVVALPEYRSAYLARGLIIEDRPVAILPVYLYARTPDFGSFGVWTRQLSSLTDRREVVKSQWFYERDWALRWRYDWRLSDDLTLRTDLDKVWMTFWNYRSPYRGKSDHTLNEWRIRQELRNPVVTPYYYIRRCIEPTDTFYFQTGLSKPVSLTGDVTLKPSAYVELCNARMMRLRYGRRLDGEDWKSGIQTVNFRLDLDWKLNDMVSLTAGVHEFVMVNEPARHCIKAKTSPWSRRDLTILSLGAKLTF